MFVLVIELRETSCHFARAGTWGCYYYERMRGFNIFVTPIAFFAYDTCRIVRIACDRVVQVAFDAKCIEAMTESKR